MQNDDVTWSIISKHHCSYKIKTDTQWFCRNEYNVTGLCNRKGCPLANSQYATIREHKGVIFLYIREAERVYRPVSQWMKVKLSKTFIKALQQIEDNLVFWPNYFKQKCRQRLLKITQYLTRMRKMKLHETKKLVPIRRKEERRLARREEKALIAAKLDHAIEKQLLERLQKGTYQRIYNFPKKAFNLRLNEEEAEDEEIEEEEEEDIEEQEEESERVSVKNEVDEEDQEMEEELREELERGLVRQRRAPDSDEETDDSDDEVDINEDSNEEEDEQDEAEENEEESADEDDVGQVEYVAHINESDDEQEMDIEDLPSAMHACGSHSIRDGNALSVKKGNQSDSSEDEEECDRIRQKKYGPQRPIKPFARFAIKKKQTKQHLRALYEKEKAKKVEKVRIRNK